MLKKYARIDGGVVAELFATDEDITELFHPDLVWIEIPSDVEVEVCFIYDGKQFSAPVAQPSTAMTPAQVTRYQARSALYQAGLLDDVEAIMADATTDRLLLIAWQDAQFFKRDSPMVLGLSAKLGLSELQIDQLFLAAAAID